MKTYLLLLGMIIGLCCCRGPHSHPDAWNPYLRSKHKPSEELRAEYSKRDRWWRRGRHKQKFYFEKK